MTASMRSFHPIEGVLFGLSIGFILYGTLKWVSEIF